MAVLVDKNTKVICQGITGSQGKGPNQYGEAHYIALDKNEDIYVGDTLNWRVQKLVKK